VANAPRVLVRGLRFPEGPRWRDGRLYVSDMHDGRVLAVRPDGRCDEVLRLDGDEPSGLGWLPDGRLLVVAMRSRTLLRLDPDGLAVHADLAPLLPLLANDMVVEGRGRAYVGNFGFDLNAGERPRTTSLALVHPDGRAELAATDLSFPNGSVVTPDGRTLIVAESFASRLTAFDVAADGRLSGRRVFAALEGAVPDGICLDADGAVWVASPVSRGVLRVREGGGVTHRVEVEHQAYACMLGGPERRTLFLCTAATHDPSATGARSGRIEAVDVDVPGAGWP
jgi:sugar lactone lactonase YvrE